MDPLRDALALGLVQGLGYVLPVSSDGHLALMQLLFGIQQPAPWLGVCLRAATFLATCIALRERCGRMLRDLSASVLQPARLWSTPGGRDALVVLLASIPTAVFGVFLREPMSVWSHSPLVIGIGLLGTSAWLLSTYWLRAGRQETPGLIGGLLIGVAQGLSILPGLSRSAGTIACALWLGVRPDRAFELSFLCSLPPLLAMIVIDARVALQHATPSTHVALASLTTLIAALVGFGILERVMRHLRLAGFALWTVPLALATLAMALVWPH
ncbi:MAG: undecaprenyl-diphosphate phosphatase [Myxococcota bacterium]